MEFGLFCFYSVTGTEQKTQPNLFLNYFKILQTYRKVARRIQRTPFPVTCAFVCSGEDDPALSGLAPAPLPVPRAGTRSGGGGCRWPGVWPGGGSAPRVTSPPVGRRPQFWPPGLQRLLECPPGVAAGLPRTRAEGTEPAGGFCAVVTSPPRLCCHSSFWEEGASGQPTLWRVAAGVSASRNAGLPLLASATPGSRFLRAPASAWSLSPPPVRPPLRPLGGSQRPLPS